MTTVVVLGATGMLGSMVLRVLGQEPQLKVIPTSRPDAATPLGPGWRTFDALSADVSETERAIEGADWIVNAIGVIKQRIDERNPRIVRSAIHVNALFPHLLAEAAERRGVRVVQIATDCVFSGARGNYSEADPHDALDVYGKTKSLGEVDSKLFRHLRCSIVGPERHGPVSLLGWFLGQPRGARIRGFSNHHWNGLTTLQFAKCCSGIIKQDLSGPSPLHLVPRNITTKAELLRLFGSAFGRTDIEVDVVEAEEEIDRTLSTRSISQNAEVWNAGGYSEPPSIEAMVAELAEFVRS